MPYLKSARMRSNFCRPISRIVAGWIKILLPKVPYRFSFAHAIASRRNALGSVDASLLMLRPVRKPHFPLTNWDRRFRATGRCSMPGREDRGRYDGCWHYVVQTVLDDPETRDSTHGVARGFGQSFSKALSILAVPDQVSGTSKHWTETQL